MVFLLVITMARGQHKRKEEKPSTQTADEGGTEGFRSDGVGGKKLQELLLGTPCYIKTAELKSAANLCNKLLVDFPDIFGRYDRTKMRAGVGRLMSKFERIIRQNNLKDNNTSFFGKYLLHSIGLKNSNSPVLLSFYS